MEQNKVFEVMEKMFVTILMNVESDLTIAKDEMEFVLTKKVLLHVHVILDMLVTVTIALIMMNARWVIISVQDRVFKNCPGNADTRSGEFSS